MDWRSYRIYCEWCKQEMVSDKWEFDYPPIDHKGRVVYPKSKEIYWHGRCIIERLKVINIKNGVYDKGLGY